MTMRSGRMQSATAAPSLRNSGLETTSKRRSEPRPFKTSAIFARTLSAVPTGTVDLVTTTFGSAMCPAMVAATASTYLQVRRAVLVRRRADGDELDAAVAHALGGVGGEEEPALGVVPLHHLLEAGLVDRDLPRLQPLDLGRVHVDAEHVVADLGQDRALHEADIARSENRDPHAPAPAYGFSARYQGVSRAQATVLAMPSCAEVVAFQPRMRSAFSTAGTRRPMSS